MRNSVIEYIMLLKLGGYNMSTIFSSAGLLYIYLNGYEENGKLFMQTIDTYRYIGDELYYRIMETLELTNEDEDIVHIFAVVGPKDKADAVIPLFKTSTQTLDDIGNEFFRCVQEFYCDQHNHFSKNIYHSYDDIVVGGICSNHMSNEKGDLVIDKIINLWLEIEQPELCGKQLMTKSFFMKDFVGRKLITSLPDIETGLCRLVFEGGHQLYLSEKAPYMKETLHPNDLGAFCSSNIQSILLTPIYAYGKWLQPKDICEEWHKVFLYLCAISDIEWEQDSIRKVYERFLSFLEENICLTMEALPFISVEEYCNSLLIHISNFREFLKGEDEPVISKDLIHILNSRYVYLPYLWSLVEPVYTHSSFSSYELQEIIEQALCENDANRKGELWEDVAAYVIDNVTGWKITGRRIKAGAQEIDMSIANISLDNELWQLGAYVLVECKNWDKHVDIHQIRNIAHISNMKGNKVSILFAANGITADAQREIERLASSNLNIICITAEDLRHLDLANDCRALIIEKWKELQCIASLPYII